MLKKLFIDKNDNTAVQLLRYSLIGVVAISVDFYFLFLLTEVFKVYYLISAACANLIGITTNYFLCTALVFDKRVLENIYLEFALFVLIGVGGLIPFVALMWFSTELCHLHYFISKIIATAIVSLGIFFIRKKLLYSTRKDNFSENGDYSCEME